jgi:hypothetical protein
MKLGFLLVLLPLAACAESVPQAALDRCKLGAADPNDTYMLRQGAACRIVAESLAHDDKPLGALSFARRACDLQDPAGCALYLTLAHSQPGELSRARASGERACDGMVVSSSGDDPRARLCFLTGELYDELEPRSPGDAGRLYALACKLGDERGCPRARSLGGDLSVHTSSAAGGSSTPRPAPPPVAPPAPTTTVISTVVAPACHEMRGCVNLDVQQHNANDVVATLTNHCDSTVVCRWCPARGSQVDTGAACHSGTLHAGETRTGAQWGLAFEGYNAMAYDCIQEHDVPGCLAL